MNTDEKTAKKFDIEITDEMVESFLKELGVRQKREEDALTKEYLDWLVNYIAKDEHHSISDDDLLYADESDDRTKSMELSYLFGALSHKDIVVVDTNTYDFPGYAIYFTYKGLTYKLETIFGQGSVTIASLYEDKETVETFEISQFFN